MPWIKIDDQFADHPKVVAAGPLAAWLHVCGLCYCGRYLTDGFIPRGQIRKLADVDDVTPLVTRLVDVGLWDECEDGYIIHDYLEYNPSGKEIKAQRKANAERQKAYRERHRKKNGRFGSDKKNSNDNSNAVTNTERTPAPSPSPSPDQVVEKKNGIEDSADAHPPACFPELFDTAIVDIKERKFKRSEWQQILDAEQAADGRVTLIRWLESKLHGAQHPAIVAYRDEMEHNPRTNQYDDIIDAIGENGNLGTWRSVVRSWRLHGWNPYNIAGMLDAYRAGGVTDDRTAPAPKAVAVPEGGYEDPDELFGGAT